MTAFADQSILERVRYLDRRIDELNLPQAQAQQVRDHRVKSLKQRQQRISKLGPCPDTSQEQSVWDKRKQEVEHQLELELQSERLVSDGLEDAWEKYQEREKLRKLREQLLESGAANGSLPLPSGPGAADAGPLRDPSLTASLAAGNRPACFRAPEVRENELGLVLW